MRKLSLAWIACIVLAVPASAGASGSWDNLLAPESACPGQSDASSPVTAQEATMVCMHNWARQQQGLGPLQTSRKLHVSSHDKAKDIKSCRQFSHEACGRDAFYWFRRVGFMRGTYGAGENLAFGSGPLGTVRDTMSAWLNSSIHRHVLLTPSFDDVGFSVVSGKLQSHRVDIWVAHFGYHH
jgi:uncharacterized protein YkwD